jgi:thiol-disulfide isomerase/thioredoxin
MLDLPPRSGARIRAPELAPGVWLNTPQPIRLAELRGRAVLVHIWDFTCLNCLRTLPYLTAWQRAFADLPITFIGIHTPEFAFAKDQRQVEAALRRHGIAYPVLLDNDQRNWDAFANRYWPTVYLIDADGYLRYQHAGEGQYAATEAAAKALALEAAQAGGQAAGLALPQSIGVMRDEDQPGAVCFRTTPELHTGYNRGALGNPSGYAPRGLPMLYQLPPPEARCDGYFYAEGTWMAGDEHFTLAGARGSLVLPYHAATANGVLAVSTDPVDLMLDLKPPITLEVTQDGVPLDSLTAGEDVRHQAGRSVVRVDAPRLYQLARNPTAAPHELRLEAVGPGLTLFAFSFSTCVR